MGRQPQWDIYESVILLDGFFETQRPNVVRQRIIERVSRDLRTMAVHRGIEIDEVYRNENGISYQMNSMESAVLGYKKYIPATKIFKETVSIYQNDKEKYSKLLLEARNLINEKTDEDESETYDEPFIVWLRSKISLDSLEDLTECYSNINSFARSIKLVKNTIFDIKDTKRIIKIRQMLLGNKDFRRSYKKSINMVIPAFQYYLSYIDENENDSELVNKKNTKPEDNRNTVPNKDIPESALPNQSFKEQATAQSCDITEILKDNYSYGFRVSSIREIMRFRQFAEKKDVALPEDDNELVELIKQNGVLIDGKIYCRNNAFTSELKSTIEGIFEKGVQVIYYEAFYDVYYDWMTCNYITSADLLKEFLLKNIATYTFSKQFLTRDNKRTEKEVVTSEILRVWGNEQTELVDDLNRKLPFIPLKNIWRVISGNDKFVLTEEGKYLLLDRFIISDYKINEIESYVELECTNNGYVSLADIPIDDITEENYNIPVIAIYNAIYKIVLSKKFCINGKILTKDKQDVDVVQLVSQYLKGKNRCTYGEVDKKVTELNGAPNRFYSMQVLYDCMVRIEKEKYVSDNLVEFDVEEIDKVLDGMVQRDFCSVKEIATFALFPLCGQIWNHYLLESYCYRFSRKYCYKCVVFNDKNAGAIVKRETNIPYNEILAIVSAESGLDLNPDSIGLYLFEKGYLARKKNAMLEDIIENAKNLREGN